MIRKKLGVLFLFICLSGQVFEAAQQQIPTKRKEAVKSYKPNNLALNTLTNFALSCTTVPLGYGSVPMLLSFFLVTSFEFNALRIEKIRKEEKLKSLFFKEQDPVKILKNNGQKDGVSHDDTELSKLLSALPSPYERAKVGSKSGLEQWLTTLTEEQLTKVANREKVCLNGGITYYKTLLVKNDVPLALLRDIKVYSVLIFGVFLAAAFSFKKSYKKLCLAFALSMVLTSNISNLFYPESFILNLHICKAASFCLVMLMLFTAFCSLKTKTKQGKDGLMRLLNSLKVVLGEFITFRRWYFIKRFADPY